MRLYLLLFLIVSSGLGMFAEDLEDVDRALDQRSFYIGRRLAEIDSLAAMTGSAKLPDVLMSLGDAYTGFDNDSALAILERGLNRAQGTEKLQFIWKHAALLPLAGLFEQARQEFSSVSRDSIPEELLPSYFDAGRQLHSYIAAFLVKHPELSAAEQEQANTYQDSLLKHLPADDPRFRYNLAESFFYDGEISKAQLLFEEIVESEPADSKYRARAAHHLAEIARDHGDKDTYRKFLCASAVADMKSATREVASLQELGALMYDQDDVQRAYRYLSSAIANSVECGAQLRMIESAKSLPLIERAHTSHIDYRRRVIYWIMAGMGVLMLVLVGVLFFLRVKMKQMRILQNRLTSANNAKEVYISQFLQLCSIYMSKLTQFCKITERKLASGQADELMRMVRSGRFVEEQSGEFYEVFDEAFLHLYPDFVMEVNSLLRADAKIELKEGEKLNTDLRILAFMRLGIEESARIAQILNYSLNTVYSYRNRLKGRAVDRENFERNVIKIDGY